MLWGGPEPTRKELLRAIDARHGDRPLREVVWCGFGEPTYRLDLITAAAPNLRARAQTIRLNTNGHACLIHGCDVLPELAAAVDEVSVSLNAAHRERDIEICLPNPAMFVGDQPPAEAFWDAMVEFLTRAPRHFRRVQSSVVGGVLTDDEIEATRELARSLRVERFRVR